MSSPVASYFYSQTSYNGLTITNGVGRRTGMSDAAGSEAWSYDPMGRVLTDRRTTNGVTYPTTYTYLPYVDGSLYSLTYPSGRVVTYQTSGAERLLSAVDNVNSINFATGAHYTPPGALAALQNGAAVNATYIFDLRLQPCWIYATTGTALPWNSTSCTGTATTGSVSDLKYNFSLGSGDNGNVTGITNNRDTTRSQSFTYDHLNRLTSAQTASTYSTSPANCWSELYQYDNQTNGSGAWGNLTNIGPVSSAYAGCTEENLSVNVDPTNRLSASSGFYYDTPGNLIQITGAGADTFAFDADNHLLSAAGVTYNYDGDGKRVEKSNGKLYWYGAGSDPLDETDLSGNVTNEFIFFGGNRITKIQMPAGAVDYYFADHLGTSRVVTNSSGTILDDSDFYPFGGERDVLFSSGNTYKFTSKERDTESGLDNFGARFDSSAIGRFMSPDEISGGPVDIIDPPPPSPLPYALITNPQSLNKYLYVYDNPLRYVDPDGHDVKDIILIKDGPNHVPNVSARGISDTTTLGEKDEVHGGSYALNTESIFDSGDNPNDYKTVRTAYILNSEENVESTRSGTHEDPTPDQTAVAGSSKFVWDAPGYDAPPQPAKGDFKRH